MRLNFYRVFSQEVCRKTTEIQRIFIKPPINWPLSGREWLHRSALFTLPELSALMSAGQSVSQSAESFREGVAVDI